MKFVLFFSLIGCLNASSQHLRIKHYKPHGHEEHLHFKPAINHCKAMVAYGHHIHHNHVEHVTELIHNIPLSNPVSKTTPKNTEIAANNAAPKDSIKPEPELKSKTDIKPEPIVDKIKSNPRLSKYSQKLDSLQPGESFNLPAITFISNQDALAVTNMDSFLEAAELAKNGYMILIEGHTDDRGDDDYNMKLSMKRVAKIKQLMVEEGVPEDNISVVGNGERSPLVPNTTDANRLQNRRIEFKIFKM